MFNVTPETHAILSLLIMVVAFLVAQIITHPDSEPPKASKANAHTAPPKPISSH